MFQLRLSDKLVIGFLAGCMVTFPASIWLTRKLDQPKGMAASFAQNGFDFKGALQPTSSYAYPDLGETIDMQHLAETSAAGGVRTLAEVLNGRPGLLVVVDPGCGFCRAARDQMSNVKDRVTQYGISYSLIAFGSEQQRTLEYRDSISPDIHLFQWSNTSQLPRKSLLEMPTPTHILVDGHGTILRIWPGSSRDKEDRSRMARQIASDTLVIVEAVAALKNVPQ
jgi:hypothetical protein